jgi:outer membrane protein insertion porin family
LTTSKNRYFPPILLCLLLTGCLGTKHLKENESLLFRQSIKAPKHINEKDLRELYAQLPNRRLFGVLPVYPLVGMYYTGLNNYDSAKFANKKARAIKKFDAKIARDTTNERRVNNLRFRKQKKIDKYNNRLSDGNQFMQWGEPLAVYDSTLLQLTVDRFETYLFSEGYFQNKITTKVDPKKKFGVKRAIETTYYVETGPAYTIDTIFYRIPDSAVHKIVKRHQQKSALKAGQRYQEKNFTAERERIDLLMKDNGYYDFSRQYVDFDIDTSMLGENKTAVMITIRDPVRRAHKQFVIDSVRFTTDAGVLQPGMQRSTRSYRDVQYKYFEDNYNLKILSQRVFLAPGSLYNRSNTFNTQRQLANLDAFKFVNINYDTSGGRFIASIFTSPLDRYEWTNEVGVNVTQGYPGPFYNLSFKKRNIFKGLENFELNGRIGFEGVASATKQLNLYKSTEAGVNAALTFPQFLWPFRTATQIRLGKYNPKTRISLGYTFTDRPEYQRTSTTFSNTYTWQNNRSTSFSAALTNISLINSKTTDPFDSVLNRLDSLGNFNLVNSFKPSFVSSMIFGITWNHFYGSTERNSTFIRSQFETGGTTLNWLIDTKFITKQELQYFQYLRFSFDFRKIKILSKWATLAYRINAGIAYSHGRNKSLPYEKYYFVGGSNSVRAWRPRRLGLGSVPPRESDEPTKDGLFDYQFEKPGEILLEGSIELRSNLVGFIDGALFIDAGNVWSFKPTTTDVTGELATTNSGQFKFNSFYREFAVGTGFGLRFDFTFLILRFDVGIKVFDPARPEGNRFVLNKAKFFKPFATENSDESFSNFKEPVIFNVGIGYPF